MFGMSFGNESPAHKEKLENQELVDSLMGVGIIDGPYSVTPEDLVAIKNRMSVIKNKLAMNDDIAAVLGYIDRMLIVENGLGNQAASIQIMTKVNTDIISALVSSPLSNDAEFLGTILTLADQKYLTGSYPAFSDALIEAVKERESAAGAHFTSGKIDAQDNVLIGEDLK